MKKIKFFIVFAFLLFLVMGYNLYEQYKRIESTHKLIIRNESQALSHFISAFRQTYQEAYLNNHIEIDDKTINLLPVKTITTISKYFSQSMKENIVIHTVSDRPRNINNMANDFELKMIRYFKVHPKKKEKFLYRDDTFFYTKPLRIKQSCLKCHGKREETIPSIRAKYENAYDYKLGEIRGLLNIKIKERGYFELLYRDFIKTLLVTVLIYFLFIVLIYRLYQKMRVREQQYTQQLETDIEKKTREIQKQKDIFETLFEKSSDGISILENGKIIQCNEKIVEILHYKSKEELLNMSLFQLSPEFQPDGRYSYEKAEEMLRLTQENGQHRFEWVHAKANAETFWCEIILTRMVLNDRNVIYMVCRDISEKKAAQKKLIEQKDVLHYQAHHDVLTGLPNRILFHKKLEKNIRNAKVKKRKFALFFIDLDQFKQINDSLGHEIGDKVLKIVAERFRSIIRKEDTLSRLGGDEFTVILPNVKNIELVSQLAQKLLAVFNDPVHVGEHKLYISCSIGITLYPKDDVNADNLLKDADAAMYKAKEEGRNNYQFYCSDMTKQAMERVVMKSSLRQALLKEEFRVYYQPQINVKSGQLIGVEALLRWKHPSMGVLSPDMFLTLAKDAGLISEIDNWVMRSAMTQISTWYKKGLEPGVLALNLTITDLNSSYFFSTLKEIMKAVDFSPQWLELEVTENEVMTKYEEVIFRLKRIHDLGIKIAIDDFGTGHSSLSYLKRLPVTKLKIDKSFVQDIPEDEEDAAIVNAIIALAKILNLDIIAEGVETVEQKEFLLQNGCENIQGYYSGKPMPAKEMEKILTEYHR